MLSVFNALFPVFLIIALGAVVKRYFVSDDGFWLGVEKVTYFILFPCLLFGNLALSDFSQFSVGPLVIILGCGQILMAVITFGLRLPFTLSGPQFTSVFQGTVRYNSFVAIAAAQSLFGQTGLALAAIGIAVMVPLANILSVYVLAQFASDRPASLINLAKTMGRNPLILSCVAGVAFNVLAIPIPAALANTLSILGGATLTLGLLAVGAGLVFANMAAHRNLIMVTTAFKLLLMPALVFALGRYFDIHGTELAVAMICAAVPSATSSYILAKQLGGDAPLMASLITAGTVVALVTMPAILMFL